MRPHVEIKACINKNTFKSGRLLAKGALIERRDDGSFYFNIESGS